MDVRDPSGEHARPEQSEDSPEPVERLGKSSKSLLQRLTRVVSFHLGHCPQGMEEKDCPKHRNEPKGSPPLFTTSQSATPRYTRSGPG